MEPRRVIIIGAAGRDFHNFNVYFRNRPEYKVCAFTATQIPNIEGRLYPASLSGSLYPKGIPIHPESELPELIAAYAADECVFSYSDVPYAHVMRLSAIVTANGASFTLLGPKDTQLASTRPVIAVGAVRTGCGKSQTSRKIAALLHEQGCTVAVIRHPMPYGNLAEQAVQRFATIADLEKHKCTIEEMEEYEPHIRQGILVYAGVDYEKILIQAQNEADVILWDGGNNDFPFYKPDLMVTVTDPLRAGDEISYYPGECTLRLADVVVINKIDSASLEKIQLLRANIAKVNPDAVVIDAASPVTADKPMLLKNARALVVEDGPTLTHGEMKFGAGVVCALKCGAASLVDPRPYAKGSIATTFQKYPGIGTLLPAMGYEAEQVKDLENTINSTDCDVVVIATPIDLGRLIKINKPTVRVSYELEEIGQPKLTDILSSFLEKRGLPKGKRIAHKS